ncbi:MAG: thioredoxin domain-containing protein [Erythrobacter sp.]|jgi:protein-disulfide isomerase|uniref:thioredoxin domain-containing protein n=1 Tax=Erythrobacter sp. TaxID=1042 RepID=UPI002B46FCC1|nr:thioredoxin domain-containing protein [Erythrobacter sp.]WRH71465.1 MAG: thioredoxin domain-containing protein [Erythrobacter sp.]
MTLRNSARTAALFGAALIAFAAPGAAQQSLADPQSKFAGNNPQGNWSATVTRTERGHLIGNPKAEAKLIEFISYTCPHCATFAMEGDPAIDLTLLGPGKMSVEVRPVIRNVLDLTVTMLVQCGDPAGFKDRHRAFMYSQSQWLAKFMSAPRSQQEIWARGNKADRMNAASALGLADILVQRGQSLAEVNACVMNDAAVNKIMTAGAEDRGEFAIPGTPSFALDGKLLNEVHDWRALYPVLSARFAANGSGAAPTP